MSLFAEFSLLGWVMVVGFAWLLRSRSYAVFRGVTLGLQVLLATALFPRAHGVWLLYVYGHATGFVHSLFLIKPHLRGIFYRSLVSIPASCFAAGTLFALPWAVLAGVGFRPPALWMPYAVAALGIAQSLVSREERVQVLVADGRRVVGLARQRRLTAAPSSASRPLSIIQITDPHLGPFMSVERLHRICQRAVERDPDLVLLTGDFLTMESQSDPELLARALSPLQNLRGRCFACLGNHDHEALNTVRDALARASIELLVDAARELETAAGPVQILGMDFVWRERAPHLARVVAAYPRRPGALRIVLLHDPSAFRHLPEGEGDLVLSGHTHGGQVGLVSLGLNWTMMRLFVKSPDHGLWGRGTDRLYVHRGTGHYGFPIRVGVPGEESVLDVYRGEQPPHA